MNPVRTPAVAVRRQLRRFGVAVMLAASIPLLWQALAQESSAPSSAGTSGKRSWPRVSAAPAAYDLAAINADPNYYRRVDTARLYQRAALPPGQARHEELEIVGDPFRIALPDSWLDQPLVVRAKPGRPVTFVAPDSGRFENGQIAVTMKADAQGLAAARFHVTRVGDYRVLAGSPENDGPAEFLIRCAPRQFRDDLVSGRHAREYVARRRAIDAKREEAANAASNRVRRRQ
jgi:hypothetical protein